MTRVHVSPDHAVSVVAPEGVPVGEHEVTINRPDRPPRPKVFRLEDLPCRDLAWDGSVSLRREDLYGDDGR